MLLINSNRYCINMLNECLTGVGTYHKCAHLDSTAR
jgi:hypothetical protein